MCPIANHALSCSRAPKIAKRDRQVDVEIRRERIPIAQFCDTPIAIKATSFSISKAERSAQTVVI